MKKDDLILNIIVKTVILILFVWFSFYKMSINLFVIIAELFIFVFLNSFVLNEKKISFNMELFCFQGMLVFLFERPIIFYWDGIPDNIYEKNFYNYNYVIYSFLFFIILVFIFFKLKKDIFWKKYFYCFLAYMVFISNVFYINLFSRIYNLFSLYFLTYFLNESWFVYWKGDILFLGFIAAFFWKKNKKIIYIYPFLILCFFVRSITNC